MLRLPSSRLRIGLFNRPSACCTEQFCLRTQQRIVTTVEDSVLRTEMGVLESQEEDTPKGILWYTT